MGAVALPPKKRVTKPEPWDVRPSRVAPEWRWAHSINREIGPFWENGGTPRDLRGNPFSLGSTVTWGTDTVGTGLSFDGATSSWAQGPTTYDWGQPFTALGYLRFDDLSADRGVVSSQTGSGDFEWAFQCWMDAGSGADFAIATRTGGGDVQVSNSTIAPDTTSFWLVGIDFDGVDRWRLWVNGGVQATITEANANSPTTVPNIGAGNETDAKNHDGHYAACHHFGRLLSKGEHVALYGDPFGPLRPREQIIVRVPSAGAQTISAPVAAATAEASAPQVAPATSVSAPGASASAEAPTASLAASVDLSPPVAPGTAEAPAPTVSPGDPTPTAPVAPSTADAPAPAVSTTVTVSLPVSPATANATAPSVVQGTSLALTVASALAESSAPGVSPGAATVSLEVAQAIADAAEPQVAASVGVGSPVADVDVTALPPSVQAAISLAAAGADVEATAAAPQASPGTATPSVPVATVTVTVLDVTVLAGELFVNTVTGDVFIARSLSGDAKVARETEGDVGIAQTLSGDVEV